MRIVKSIACFSLTLAAFAPEALAQNNPHLFSKGAGYLSGDYEEQTRSKEDQKTFTGSIERLLDMAGKDSSTSEHWKDFEDISGTPAEENYHSTMRWKMEKENRKPIPRRKSFESTLDSVAEHLQRIKPTKARQRREKLQDHF